MDGTRRRRTRDQVRQEWYARHRQRRFARMLGFAKREEEVAAIQAREAGQAGES